MLIDSIGLLPSDRKRKQEDDKETGIKLWSLDMYNYDITCIHTCVVT